MNEVQLKNSKAEIIELEKTLGEKKIHLQRQLAELNLRDSNIAFRVSELDLLYQERNLEQFKNKLDALNKYLSTYELDSESEDCDLVKEVENFCSYEEMEFPKFWGIRSTMQIGLISTFAGGTGSGKTRLLVDLASEYFLSQKNIAIFTMEVEPGSLTLKIAINIIYKRTKEIIGYKTAKLLWKRKPVENFQWLLLKSTIETIGKYVKIIRLKRYTAQNIYSSINFRRMEKGIDFKLVAIDYFQILKPNSKDNESLPELQRNNIIAEEMRVKILELKLPCIMFAQISQSESENLKKENTSGTGGINYAPGLTHASENVFKIYREKLEDGKYSNVFQLRQVKARDEVVGNYDLSQEMVTGAII